MTFLTTDRVLYTPERLASIAAEAAKGDAIFSLKDRIGLVHDAFALSRAGFAQVSSALTFVDIIKDEKECEQCDWFSFAGFLINPIIKVLVWDCVAENLSTLVSVWWEQPRLTASLNTFRRVCFNNLPCLVVQTEVPFAGVVQSSGCSFRIRIF
jgi:aminopeptidase 2